MENEFDDYFQRRKFANHPLAPCVVLFFETLFGKPLQLSGLVVVETDDLLGGGRGPRYHEAIDALRKRYLEDGKS